MGLFKSLRQAYRGLSKPGSDIYPTFTSQQSTYMRNANTDPTSDQLGNQWVGNAYDPLPLERIVTGVGRVNDRFVSYPRGQFWKLYRATDICYVGFDPFDSSIGRSVAIYHIVATAQPLIDGVASLNWFDSPIYLQIFELAAPGVPPALGEFPQWVAPVPRPPNILDWHPDVRIPFNGGATGIGAGAAIAFSKTRDEYTPPDFQDPKVGCINVSTAPYGNEILMRTQGQ